MKKILFVFNPNSGKAQIKNNLLKIVQIFSKNNYEVEVYPTKAEKDAYEYIKSKEGTYDLLVCSGGDGTLNESVAAVMSYKGRRPEIGYIPSGTTNDFATSLNIPKNMIEAALHIVGGSPVSCDIGIMNKERYFNYVAAFGAFTEVSYATPQSLKNILGHQAYVLEGVKSITDLKAYSLKITADDIKTEGRFIYGMVSNTESVGGMKGLVGSGIDLQDGLFEVTLIRQIKSAAALQQLVTAFVSQNFEDCDVIFSLKAKHIEFDFDGMADWTLDGEYGGKHEHVEFDVMERAIDFIVQKKKKKARGYIDIEKREDN